MPDSSVVFCCISELNDRQTGNAPEVARIDRQHGVAERERCRTDEEIGEWNHDSAALLLRVQLAGEPCNVRGQRIDRDGGKKPSKGEGVEQSPRRSVMLTARRP